jgi:hypothetical protein
LFIFGFNMLRKPLAFLLLICHVNFFMFIAQVDEVDVYDTHGCRINDVNSLAEYVNDVILHRNKPRQDEDDNNARYFHPGKLAGYSFSQQVVVSKPADVKNKMTYPSINTQKIFSIFYDVATPPPKGLS